MTNAVRVLVIDDEEDVADLVGQMLEMSGHVVATAVDGEAGVASAQTAPPDVAIVDLMLPGIDGFEVCRQLRSDSRTRRARLLVLSGLHRADVRERAAAAGADRFLAKPFDPATLVREVYALAAAARSEE